jgi:glycosyltransferase involved in cell wall biosynthesis
MRRPPLRDVKFLALSVLNRKPFLIIRDQVPAMTNTVGDLVTSEPFDAVHADQLWMAQYALAAQAASPGLKLVLDQHNAVHLIPQRLADGERNLLKQYFLAREARLLAIYEPEICRHFDHVAWVTEEDRRAVSACAKHSAHGVETHSTVVPICTDPTLTDPVEPAPVRKRITFLGGLHWPPNVQGVLWFAKHVLPEVRKEMPEAVLTVIGKSPPAGLEGDGVEITGYVADLMPYLAETGAFIVPLHAGGGMRVKIIDAWSWGLPIVSTTIGAEGIAIQSDENILIADSTHSFAQAVIRVLRDPSLAEKLGLKGRQTILEKYDWRVIYSAWDDIYRGEQG